MPSEFVTEQKVELSTVKYSQLNLQFSSATKSMEKILYHLQHKIVNHKSSFALLYQTLTNRVTSQIANIFFKTNGNGKWY